MTGLALLIIRGKDVIPPGLTVLPLINASHLVDTDPILVVGHPRSAGDWTILRGTVVKRQERYLVIDATIDDGTSGAPILDSGDVVGLVGEVRKYGRGVASGSIQEYLKGHGLLKEAALSSNSPAGTVPSPRAQENTSSIVSEITGKDGVPMVSIPAGQFMMGSPDSEGDEHPRHQVTLDGFYMDKFEVTVARYTEFVRAKNRPKPVYWDQVDSSKYKNLPVVGVDWHDAKAYCEWAGKRLPTEAEWEKAARGMDGRTYPWGNEQPTARLANFGKVFTTNVYDKRLAPVDSYEAGNSPYGLHYMAGNAWEWMADWYGADYYESSPARNPKGPSSGQYRVLRGGSWNDGPGTIRSATRDRNWPAPRYADIGFRCAQDAK